MPPRPAAPAASGSPRPPPPDRTSAPSAPTSPSARRSSPRATASAPRRSGYSPPSAPPPSESTGALPFPLFRSLAPSPRMLTPAHPTQLKPWPARALTPRRRRFVPPQAARRGGAVHRRRAGGGHCGAREAPLRRDPRLEPVNAPRRRARRCSLNPPPSGRLAWPPLLPDEQAAAAPLLTPLCSSSIPSHGHSRGGGPCPRGRPRDRPRRPRRPRLAPRRGVRRRRRRAGHLRRRLDGRPGPRETAPRIHREDILRARAHEAREAPDVRDGPQARRRRRGAAARVRAPGQPRQQRGDVAPGGGARAAQARGDEGPLAAAHPRPHGARWPSRPLFQASRRPRTRPPDILRC